MRKLQILFGALKLPLDAILIFAAFFLAFQLRAHNFFPFDFLGIHLGEGALDPLSDYLHFATIATIILLILLIFNGQFNLRTPFRPLRNLVRLIVTISAWMMLIIAFFFLTRELFFSRAVLAYVWILTTSFLWLGHLSLHLLSKLATLFSKERINILFIGAGETASRLSSELSRDPRHHLLGSLISQNSHRESATLKILGPLSDLSKIHSRHHIHEIFQTASLDQIQTAELLAFCRDHQIELRFLPSILELTSKNIDLETISGLPVVFLKPSRLDGWGRILKRFFDIIISIFALIIFSPLLIFIAIGVKISSPGPIFFLDFRAGKNKSKFIFFKFRSMRADLCDGEIHGTKKGNEALEKLAKSEDNMRAGPLHKIKSDPRRTRFGNFIRKTSLDELPQFWNVLKGDMSLVGPRPHMTKEVANYESWHNRVFAIKPGITGLAQISGRSDLDFDEEVRLDLSYLENWSFFLDLVILIKTPFVLIFRSHQE